MSEAPTGQPVETPAETQGPSTAPTENDAVHATETGERTSRQPVSSTDDATASAAEGEEGGGSGSTGAPRTGQNRRRRGSRGGRGRGRSGAGTGGSGAGSAPEPGEDQGRSDEVEPAASATTGMPDRTVSDSSATSVGPTRRQRRRRAVRRCPAVRRPSRPCRGRRSGTPGRDRRWWSRSRPRAAAPKRATVGARATVGRGTAPAVTAARPRWRPDRRRRRPERDSPVSRDRTRAKYPVTVPRRRVGAAVGSDGARPSGGT